MEKTFYQTLELIFSSVGENAFYHNKQFNRSLFETICLTISLKRNHKIDPTQFERFYKKIIKDEEFWQLSKSATTSKKSILTRIEFANRLFEKLG